VGGGGAAAGSWGEGEAAGDGLDAAVVTEVATSVAGGAGVSPGGCGSVGGGVVDAGNVALGEGFVQAAARSKSSGAETRRRTGFIRL